MKRAQNTLIQQANENLIQTKMRLSQISRDPEFNAYQDLCSIQAKDGGLHQLYALKNKKTGAVFNAHVSKAIGLESSPLTDDIAKLKRALRKPSLSAPLDIPESGLVKIPNNEAFRATLSALTVLPALYAQFSEREEQISGHLLALQLGRRVCLQASTLEHYLAGVELQDLALSRLRTLLKSHKLSAAAAKTLYIRLQMEVSSSQELLPVLDAEYLLATRVLESKNFAPKELESEKLGLASRYLKMRPYFLEAKPPAEGFRFQDEVPELLGCEWASQQPDYVLALGRSRRAATHLAAVELLAALEARKLEKGNYPAKLEDLIPAYLTRIPPDSLSESQTFRFELKGESFTLSSQPTGSKSPPIIWW